MHSSRMAVCILARNEERRIEGALKSLQGRTDRIVLIDNESEDRTFEVARPDVDLVLTAPRSSNFGAARNRAVEGYGSAKRGRGWRVPAPSWWCSLEGDGNRPVTAL